jgi:hypothetical protein
MVMVDYIIGIFFTCGNTFGHILYMFINDFISFNNQNIDNSECFGVKFVKIYPEMTSQ